MGWTDLSTWDGNYQSLDFLNEYVEALNERLLATDRGQWFSWNPTLLKFEAGDTLVGPTARIIQQLQSRVSSLFTYGWFVRHMDASGNQLTTLDNSENGLMYLNHWTLQKAAPFFTGMSEATSFRRYQVHPSEGNQPQFGVIGSSQFPGSNLTGDIIGPWIFEDLQRAINLLVWTAHWGYWPADNRPKARAGGGSSPSDALTNFASNEEYAPGYGQSDWFNFYHYTNNDSYGVESTRETIQAQWPEKSSWGTPVAPVGPGVNGLMDVYATPHTDNTEYEFDAGGFGLHGTTWTLMQSNIPIGPNDAVVTANQLGTTSYVPGGWPATKHYRGYIPSGEGSYPRLLCRWNVAGGFEYT